MIFIIQVLALILKSLIAVGDSVLFFVHRLETGIILCLLFIRSNIQKLNTMLYNAILSLKKASKKIRLEIFSKPLKRFRAHLFTLQAKRSKTLLQVKRRKKNLTKTSFFSLSFFMRHMKKGSEESKKQTITKNSLQKKFHKKPLFSLHLPFIIKFRYFLAGSIFSFLFLFLPLLFLIFLQDLPNPKSMSMGQIPQTTKIYDRNGTLLYQIYGGQNRTIVPLSDIPKYLQLATIATEDKDFYKHPGFDILAIIRSAIENASGKQLQGGSTLTQQLIKSALLSPETSISRKVKEAILAFWAERIYTKNQILEMYFNQIPYGGTAWGAEAAAQTYFGKHVKELNLAESAFLAGIPRAPTIYSPYGSTPTLWKKRQKEVLYRMVGQKYITEKEAKAALSWELTFEKPQTPIHAPHFVMYVKDFLVRKYGLPMVEKGGLTVRTSIDLKSQENVEKIVAEEVNNDAYLNLTNGAAVVTNPKNGDILAMVGSRDFTYPKFGNVNVATSLRQPGSSIKVLTYSAALSSGLTAATILDDSPITFTYPGGPSYTPVNYDGKSHGRIPLRIAFANSFNITAVRTLNQIGIPTMVQLGKRMGIKSWGDPEEYGLSITLGAAEATMLDMATVYGSVANGGEKIELNPIIEITDFKGNILEKKQDVYAERVLDKGVAYIISNILSDNGARAAAFGPNSVLQIPGKTVSVKTGTTDWKKDNWTIGYTPSYVVTVWVGNNDGSPMSQTLASGITGAAPIWNKIMTMLLADKEDEKPIVPDNIVAKACLGRMEWFVRGTENSVNCAYVFPTRKPSPEQTH
ncbi:MAG: penicillin-binding protein [Candidatus Levybacteria bacterium]|nr:penicillin-binding protein [Candidatus Levybacteria bacterium]